MKPISPNEIVITKKEYIHKDILEIVNNFLGERYYKNGSVTIKQSEVVEKFIEKNPHMTETFILMNGYLDFEDAYENEGWLVEYHKPELDGKYFPYYEFFSKNKI